MSPHYRPFGAYRFLLAVMVVVSHTHLLAGGSLSAVLGPLGLGNMAVMSFFVLSGFVIAEAIATYYRGRPGAFLVNRLLRIFPPFVVALGFSLLVHWAIIQFADLRVFDPLSDSQRSLMFTARNILANTLCLVVIYGLSHLGLVLDYLFVRFVWAVAVELHFYYVAAALVFCAGLASIRKAETRLPLFWWSVAVLFATLFILSMVSPQKLLFYAVWIPYFALGVAIFHLVDDDEEAKTDALNTSFLVRYRWRIWGALAAIGVNWHAYAYMSKNPANWAGVDLAILNLLAATLFFLGRSTASGPRKAIDRWVGDITYPLYLNHYAVSIATLSLVPAEYRGVPLFVGNLAFCIAASLGLSYVSEPFTRSLRNRIRGASV